MKTATTATAIEKISFFIAAMSFFSLTASAQLNQTPTMNLAPTPVPTATPAPVVGQNLPPAPQPVQPDQPVVQPPQPTADSSVPQFQPPVQPAPVNQPTVDNPRSRSKTANPAIPPSQLPVQPHAPDVVTLPSGAQATGQEKFEPSEVVTAPSSTNKSTALRAVLRTSMGDITMKLDRINAPRTVAQFVALARGEKEFIDVKTGKPVKRPFYNGLIFHRVVKGTLIQTGDPFGTGRGDAGSIAPLADEIKPMMKFSKPGMVAMAPMRDANGTGLVKNSNNSQFFITLREMPEWDGQFTIFGEVEDGMDVVQKIANSKVGPTERPIKKVFLIAVEIIEN